MRDKLPTAKQQLEMYESLWKGAAPNPHLYLLAKSYRDAIEALCDCVLHEVDIHGHCEICGVVPDRDHHAIGHRVAELMNEDAKKEEA